MQNRTSNPTLRPSLTDKFTESEGRFEISGAVTKTFLLFAILVLCAIYPINLFMQGMTDKVNMLMAIGSIGGLITALIIIFSKSQSLLAPLSILYAGLEGLCVGSFSAYAMASYGTNLVINAVLSTFCVLAVMLILYTLRIIRPTAMFTSVITIATFSIAIIYFVSFIMSFIFPQASSVLMNSSPVGIGFSIVVCFVAAFNLILDFGMIEEAGNLGYGKSFEWYMGFSLMVTLVWLYIEILRLLSKIASRD